MRHRLVFAFVTICTVVAGCGSNSNGGAPATPTSNASPGTGAASGAAPATPVAVAALDGLLISPAEISDALGGPPGLSVEGHAYDDFDDNYAFVEPKNCTDISESARKDAYDGSGWTDVRSQYLSNEARQPSAEQSAVQAVVRFPSPQQATDFFNTEVRRWQACSNQRFIHTQGAGKPWLQSGSVTNANNTLTATITALQADLCPMQRALTYSNNVVIDVSATSCSANQQAAVNIAQKIAAKVPT